MNIGKQLEHLLEQERMTQKQLAEALHIHRSTLNGYIKNRRQPDFDTIAALTRYFNTTSDYLLGLSDQQTPLKDCTPGERAFLIQYRKLSNFQKSILNQILQLFAEQSKHHSY